MAVYYESNTFSSILYAYHMSSCDLFMNVQYYLWKYYLCKIPSLLCCHLHIPVLCHSDNIPGMCELD